MKHAGVRAGVGTRFMYDGEIVEVIEVHSVDGSPQALVRHLRTQTVARFALSELMFSPGSRLMSEDLVVEADRPGGDVASVKWSAAPERARRRAGNGPRMSVKRLPATGRDVRRPRCPASLEPSIGPRCRSNSASDPSLMNSVSGYARSSGGSNAMKRRAKPVWCPPGRSSQSWAARPLSCSSTRRWTSWSSAPRRLSRRRATSSTTPAPGWLAPMTPMKFRYRHGPLRIGSSESLSANILRSSKAPNLIGISRRAR